MDGRVKPGHDDLNSPPNKKAGVAAGFCLVTPDREN
jgi:hypothetical protein